MRNIVIIALSAILLVLCLAVTAGAADYVYYENDFSDASDLEDFTVYRGKWDIVDGKLQLVDFGGLAKWNQAWLLYIKDAGVNNLTDYILEVDMYNTQTQAGPIYRCDRTMLKKLYKAGIVGGDAGTGNYRPDDSLKRSEACVFFARIAMPVLRIK